MGNRFYRACAIVLIAVAVFLLVDDFVMLSSASPKFSGWQMLLDFAILFFAMLSV